MRFFIPLPQSGPASTLLAVASLLSSIIALGVGTSFAKGLFPLIGAEGTTALRVFLSAVILVGLWRPWRMRLQPADLRTLLAYGVALGSMNLLFYMSLRTLPLGVALAIEFIGPLGVALCASRRVLDFAWVGLAALGLGLLLPIGQGATALDPTGVACALGAAACWALYIVFGQRAGRLHGGQAVSLGMSIAAITVLPFGIANAGTALFSPSLLLIGLGVAILSSALPYSLEMVALKRLPKQVFGVLLSMEPAVGALAGLVLLSEQLSAVEWLAIGCIVLASVGTTLSQPRKTNPLGAAEQIA